MKTGSSRPSLYTTPPEAWGRRFAAVVVRTQPICIGESRRACFDLYRWFGGFNGAVLLILHLVYRIKRSEVEEMLGCFSRFLEVMGMGIGLGKYVFMLCAKFSLSSHILLHHLSIYASKSPAPYRSLTHHFSLAILTTISTTHIIYLTTSTPTPLQ